MTEGLRCFDPRGASAGPHGGNAGRPQRIGHARRERRLRPDHGELDGSLPGDAHDRLGVEGIDDRPSDARLAGDRVRSRRDDHLVDARLRGELPGQRVLPPAAADNQDPRRLGRATHHGVAPPVAIEIVRSVRTQRALRRTEFPSTRT